MLNKIEVRLRLCKCTVICKNSVGILGSTHDDFQSSVFLSNLCSNPFFSDAAFCSRRNFCFVKQVQYKKREALFFPRLKFLGRAASC